MPEAGAVTQLLGKVREGNVGAEAELVELLYAELQRLARRYMRKERPTHTLQPTALVNEAYIRLIGQEAPSWQNRAHFLAHAARAMRQILVDHARRRRTDKRGGQHFIVSLDEITSEIGEPLNNEAVRRSRNTEELLAIDEALTALASLDPRQAQIVELRFFSGLDEKQIAQALDISERSVRRDFRTARLWLRRRMKGG